MVADHGGWRTAEEVFLLLRRVVTSPRLRRRWRRFTLPLVLLCKDAGEDGGEEQEEIRRDAWCYSVREVLLRRGVTQSQRCYFVKAPEKMAAIYSTNVMARNRKKSGMTHGEEQEEITGGNEGMENVNEF